MMAYPISKTKLGSEGRYESRYFHLSFQLSADPVLTGERRDGDLHGIVCGEDYTEACWQQHCDSVPGRKISPNRWWRRCVLKPFVCLKKNLIWSFSLLIFTPLTISSWAEYNAEISPPLPPDTSLPQKLRKHNLYSLPSYWGQEMVQGHSDRQKSFQWLGGIHIQANVLENCGWVGGETSVHWHEQRLAFQKHRCVWQGRKWQQTFLVLSNKN